jgi:hypothetical protein
LASAEAVGRRGEAGEKNEQKSEKAIIQQKKREAGVALSTRVMSMFTTMRSVGRRHVERQDELKRKRAHHIAQTHS